MPAERYIVPDIENRLGPSEIAAEMYGILCSGGSVSPRGAISLKSSDPQLLDVFETVGEEVFGLPARRVDVAGTAASRNPLSVVYFHNRDIKDRIGRFKRDTWHWDIIDFHSWVYTNPKYVSAFFSGFYCVNGNVKWRNNSHGRKQDLAPYIQISISRMTGFRMLAGLFSTIGIYDVKRINSKSAPEGIRGLAIYRQSDLDLFTKNVKPRLLWKAQELLACGQESIPLKELKEACAYLSDFGVVTPVGERYIGRFAKMVAEGEYGIRDTSIAICRAEAALDHISETIRLHPKDLDLIAKLEEYTLSIRDANNPKQLNTALVGLESVYRAAFSKTLYLE